MKRRGESLWPVAVRKNLRYAHIYHHHYQKLEELEISTHLNHVFKRFILFNLVPAEHSS